MLQFRRKEGKRPPGHQHRQELRQVRDRGSRTGPRRGILARAHAARQGEPRRDYQGQHPGW